MRISPSLPAVAADAPVVLEVQATCAQRPIVNGVSFDVRAGEIVGLAGLVGAGRTEIVRAIAGADVRDRGERSRRRTAPRIVRTRDAASHAGIAFITEDRKAQGLVLGMTVRENTTLAHLARLRRARPFIDRPREVAVTTREIAELRIRTPSTEQIVRNLSGGNAAEGRAREVAASAKRASFFSTSRRAASTSEPRPRSTA